MSHHTVYTIDEHIEVHRLAGSDTPGAPLVTLEARKIGIIFSLEGVATMRMVHGNYAMTLDQGQMYIMYNPQTDLAMKIEIGSSSRLWLMIFSIEKIHELFMGGHQSTDLFDAITIDKRFYNAAPISNAMYMVLEQLFFARVPENTKNMYMMGKVLEVLSLYFGGNDELDISGCPFLKDEATVQKVHKAKEILLQNMMEPPTIKELSVQVGLNEYQLKAGFKRLYGSPIFQFLNDHRLNHAQHLLMSGRYKVNEVAWEIGYTNPSHFIAAYKRKFKITPKKFLMQQQ
jgi:AraC family transcriptional regulator, transcriptional activator of the genes for pyochelin and ferripyochelin receptors